MEGSYLMAGSRAIDLYRLQRTIKNERGGNFPGKIYRQNGAYNDSLFALAWVLKYLIQSPGFLQMTTCFGVKKMAVDILTQILLTLFDFYCITNLRRVTILTVKITFCGRLMLLLLLLFCLFQQYVFAKKKNVNTHFGTIILCKVHFGQFFWYI